MDALPPPGTLPFLPALLAHIHTVAPGLPLEPVLVQVLLLCILAGDRHLILRTRDDDITLVAKLTALALGTVFGYSTHRLKCNPNCAHQTPSEFLRSLFFSVTPPAEGLPHKHRHRRNSNSVGKSPIAPSASISTARSRRTSISRSSKPSIATLGRPQLDSEDATAHPSFHSTGAQTDTPVPSIKTHLRNLSRGSTETPKLPTVIVVSGLELASLSSQKAVLRTLAERHLTVSDGHDQDDLILGLPDGFFMVYVCRSDPWERPPIYKSLLDMFAMSSSVDIGPQTRLAIRQYRPNPSSPPTALASPQASVTSTVLPTLQTTGLTTPSSLLAAPVIPSALLQQLKHLCLTQARIRPPLNIYLADLFSAVRHYGPLDGMMLTVRARQDAEALARASRVLGTDSTGAELIKEHAEQAREADSITTYPHSPPSMAGASSDALVDRCDTYEPLDVSSVCHSLTGPSEQTVELDVSEADIARMFPRVVSHRIRVRDSPLDEILSSAVCGATTFPGNEVQYGESVQWERETVKDILVHILAEV